MSFIAAVRVRVEREGRRGGSEKKKGSQRGDPNIHYSTFMCALLFFSLLSFSAKFYFLFLLLRLCAARSASPHSLTRVTAHVTFKTKRPSKKNPQTNQKTKKTQPWFGRTRRSAAVTRESVALTFHLVTLQIETLQHKAKKVSN